MNSAKLQDTRLIYRNLWCLFTLIMKYKKKWEKIPFKSVKNNKITSNNLNQRGERPIH